MTNSRALYQKYRPETFKDVVGQGHVISVLEGMITKNMASHAYLFAGSRGVGKTTIARIFARELGCSSDDIFEIDGASHRKIEDIRQLRDAVHTLPFSSKYKVYIIDEVHMLTREAFNALLKTLEEPPAHVIFMFATTEPEKVPDTIRSRCQVYDLTSPSIVEISKHTIRVADEEGYKISKISSDLVALAARGSFRDGLGVLQKVLAASVDTTIGDDEVARIIGSATLESLTKLLKGLAENDSQITYETLYEIIESGAKERMLLFQMANIVRQIMRARFSPVFRKEFEDIYADTQIVEWLGKDGVRLNAGVLEILLRAHGKLRSSHIPGVILELAFAEILGHNSTAS